MAEQFDEAFGEDIRSVVPSLVRWSIATPEGKGCLDDVVQLFDNKGP
jgi:hypothetical protein